MIKKEPKKKSRVARMSRPTGPKMTVIGGQKVDLNSEKPQYLKLTLEQIQMLALQQRSGWKIFLVFLADVTNHPPAPPTAGV